MRSIKIIFFMLNFILVNLLTASVAEIPVEGEYCLKTDNIRPSRFYNGRFLQIAVINCYDPIGDSSLAALRIPTAQTNPNFTSAFGLSSYSHVDLVIQEPSDGSMRAHHALHRTAADTPATSCYARFPASVSLHSIYPNSVSIGSSLDINIHAGRYEAEPVLSPNDGHITVAGKPLRDYVAENGSVLFLTKISGNGQTIATLHFVVHDTDRDVLRSIAHKNPRNVGEYLALMKDFNDPRMSYFTESILGKSVLPSLQEPDYFPTTAKLIAQLRSDKLLTHSQRVQLAQKLTSTSVISETDTTAEDDIVLLQTFDNQRLPDSREFQIAQAFPHIERKILASMQSTWDDASLPHDDKMNKLKIEIERLLTLHKMKFSQQYKYESEALNQFLAALIQPLGDAVHTLNTRGYAGNGWKTDAEIFCKDFRPKLLGTYTNGDAYYEYSYTEVKEGIKRLLSLCEDYECLWSLFSEKGFANSNRITTETNKQRMKIFALSRGAPIPK